MSSVHDNPASALATRMLRLKVVSDGSPAGTRIVDVDTGEVLAFDGWVRMPHLTHDGTTGKARIVLTFDADVEATAAVKGPFALLGNTGAGRTGAPPPVVLSTAVAFKKPTNQRGGRQSSGRRKP